MCKLMYLVFLCVVCVDSKLCTEKRRLYSPEGYDWDQQYYSHVREVTVRVCCEGYQETAESLSLRIYYELKDHLECEPICDIPCVNGYCSAPGTCTCSPGYSRAGDSDICSPVCDVACERGTCVAPDKCTCLSGYELVDGSCNPVCSEPCVNGVCVSPERCICPHGYRHFVENICEPCEGDACLSKYVDDDSKVETVQLVRLVDYKIVNILLPLSFTVTALVLLFLSLHWTPMEVNVVDNGEKQVYCQQLVTLPVPELPDKSPVN